MSVFFEFNLIKEKKIEKLKPPFSNLVSASIISATPWYGRTMHAGSTHVPKFAASTSLLRHAHSYTCDLPQATSQG